MRLIDADALIEVINRHCYPVQHDMTSIEPGMTRIGILQAIQEQPTVEPERKRGEWINSYKRQTCSVCKQRGYRSWSFCPNCGADMRGERNEL